MSKKNLLSTPVLLLAGRTSVISILAVGSASSVWSQTYNSTLSFSGSGSLKFSTYAAVPVSIGFSTLAGSPPSTDTTTTSSLGGGIVSGSSSLEVYADVTVPNSVNAIQQPVSGTYSISQNDAAGLGSSVPVGPDPGLQLAGQYYAAANSSLPLDGVYPPTPGTYFTGTDSANDLDFYQDGSAVLSVEFNGNVKLTLGTNMTEVVTANGGGNDTYAFTYDDSELDVDASISGADPTIAFIGDVTFTTEGPAVSSVPDSAPGLVGMLTLAGVCVAGAWQQKARKA